jgi:hypothetical protein
MSESDETLHCATHGQAHTTYVCGHLAAKPAQQWFCDTPSEDNPWPDAWCKACDAEYLKAGEWNDDNSGCLDLQLLCNHCYSANIAASVDCLTGDALEAWEDTIGACHEELRAKQDALEAQFKLGTHKRYDYDQEKATLVFSNDGVHAVVADVEFIGSVSTKSNSWLWAWANLNTLPPVRTRIVAVRDFGEDKCFPHLTAPRWTADEVDGWEMAGIAVQVLGAKGVYRVPGPNGCLFMAIMNMREAP